MLPLQWLSKPQHGDDAELGPNTGPTSTNGLIGEEPWRFLLGYGAAPHFAEAGRNLEGSSN